MLFAFYLIWPHELTQMARKGVPKQVEIIKLIIFGFNYSTIILVINGNLHSTLRKIDEEKVV
jgi:hypothetical protein